MSPSLLDIRDRRRFRRWQRRSLIGTRASLLCAAAIIAGLIFVPFSRIASAHSENGGEVLVDHPVATPAKAGGKSRLLMRLENDTHSRIHIVGLATPVATSAVLMVSVGRNDARVLGSIAIPAGEELRVNTSHMWFELAGLTRDLVIGERFPATLEFVGGGRMTVEVLVSDKPIEPNH